MKKKKPHPLWPGMPTRPYTRPERQDPAAYILGGMNLSAANGRGIEKNNSCDFAASSGKSHPKILKTRRPYADRLSKAAIACACIFLCFSCCPKRVAVRSHFSDSLHVVTKVEYIETLRDTVVFVSVPRESSEALKRDSSFLETSFAESSAKILPDGSLYHSLSNKPRDVAAPVQIKHIEERRVEKESAIRQETVEVTAIRPLRKAHKFLAVSGLLFWGSLVMWLLFRGGRMLARFKSLSK